MPLGPGAHRILDEAFARDVVKRYLDAMAAGEWDTLAATLAPDVERVGPYGDDYRGRAPYAKFLADIIGSLSGYALVIVDMIVDGNRVAVELNETVDDGDARLRTDETVVFDVGGGSSPESPCTCASRSAGPPIRHRARRTRDRTDLHARSRTHAP